ncbi:DUF1523 family protein [Aliiroseovarius sp. 2305UL8-7]|uniref:DUF1523 family protein n=1 Tax=Aliiroseovarius conchicola TaxID=3121637 RepID=UPI003527D0AC
MKKIKTTFRVVIFLILAAFFSYVLPQHDVVRITSTEIIRQDFSSVNRIFYAQADSGNAENPTRDIRLINTVKRKTFLLGFIPRDAEKVMVYRNEDTGWIWPPYFKFDSSDLQAEAAAVAGKGDGNNWAVITKYGWRNRFFTIFPNAVRVRSVPGPDVSIIPWFNIFFFIFLAVVVGFVRALWRQFRERSIDPAIEDASEAWDAVDARAGEAKGRFSRWVDSWRSKK